MKNRTLILMATFGALSAISAHAESFNTKCPDVIACTKYVGELLGQKYIYDPRDIRGKMDATANLEITKDNAELLFTTLLNQQGFTRVPLNDPNTFQIMRQREARDSIVPIIKSDKSHEPKLPNTWDMVTLEYKATNSDIVEHMARHSRSFMPANSRIIPEEASGTVLITDSAVNLKKLYEIIKGMDVKPSAELKKQWEERRKEWNKREFRHKEVKKAENTVKKE